MKSIIGLSILFASLHLYANCHSFTLDNRTGKPGSAFTIENIYKVDIGNVLFKNGDHLQDKYTKLRECPYSIIFQDHDNILSFDIMYHDPNGKTIHYAHFNQLVKENKFGHERTYLYSESGYQSKIIEQTCQIDVNPQQCVFKIVE